MTAAEAKEALEQRKMGERSRRQQEDMKKVDILLEQKKMEEERRRKTIIAPDGEQTSCSDRATRHFYTHMVFHLY